MKKTDMRFDLNIINKLIGKTFKMYKCDMFDYTNSVTQIVGLFIDDQTFSLSNVQESVDYYGSIEDISIFRFNITDAQSIQSAFLNTDMICTPVNASIDRIVLVNEKQSVNVWNEMYEIWLTRGIIFYVDGREISFEKDSVPFSEEIYIRRGYNLLDSFSSEKDFLDGWNENDKPSCTREIITVGM